MTPILEAARAGFVTPLWSPCIIEETSRLLAWLELRRAGSDFSDANWDRLSQRAKAWFSLMSSLFEVVDDRPPYADQWSDPPRDPGDVPIWTAAIRGNAHVIVTENLKDGPPADEGGIRRYRGVWFMDPEMFGMLVGFLADLVTSRRVTTLKYDPSLAPLLATADVATAPPSSRPKRSDLPKAIQSFLDELESRENASEQKPEG